jgi:ribosomal protein L22
MGKHRSNPQYFKGKKLQSKIFNQLNIKKVKSTKIILEKTINEKKRKLGKKKKESKFGKNKHKKKEKRGKLEKKSKKKDEKKF